MAKMCVKLLICVTLMYAYTSCTEVNNSMDELKRYFVTLIVECSKENPISQEVLQQMRENHTLPDNENVRCMFACVYKKGGMVQVEDQKRTKATFDPAGTVGLDGRSRRQAMDENGMMSVTGIHELTQKYVADPAIMQKAMAFTEACKAVNDAEVGDGTRGCDRAALLFRCSVEKSSEFNLGM